MQKAEGFGQRWLWMLAFLVAINAFLILQVQFNMGLGQGWHGLRQGILGKAHIIFFSIILEAMPFVIMGVIGSTVLEVLVSPEFIRRLLPRTWFLGILIAGFLGVLFPFCECGLVPITRRLMEKGVPAPLAAVFLLTAPIVNPVVAASTRLAFFSQPAMVYWRLGGAYAVAVLSGCLLLWTWRDRNAVRLGYVQQCGCCSAGQDGHRHSRLAGAFSHAQDEFFSILRYLAIGAFLAACTQVFLPREQLLAWGGHAEGSVGVMMGLAFILSVCSGADAFVANALASSFSPGAVLAFMVFGPMVDLKNLLMLLAAFKKSFVTTLVCGVVLLVFALGVMVNHLGVM